MIDMQNSRSPINGLAVRASILCCTFLVPAIARGQEFDKTELLRMVREKDYPELTDSEHDTALALELLKLLGGHRDRIGNVYLSRKFTDEDMPVILAFQDATGIIMADSPLSDDAMKYIGRMKGLLYLGKLPETVTDVGVSYLRGLPLKGFALPPRATDESMDSLAAMPQLYGVALSKNITDKGFRHVAEMHGIHGIYLNDSQVTDAAFENIGQNPLLTTIDFGTAPNITPEVVKHLRELKQLLHVVGPQGTNDRTLELLADVKTLTRLDLSTYEGVTDQGVAYLPAHERMHDLSLGPNITDAGMEHVGKLKWLGNLDLTKTQVTGKGLAWLGPRGPSKLEISDSVSDEGLASISKFTGLTCLVLHGNFTDACLTHLPKRLNQVHLQHTNVTQQGLKQLRRDHLGLIITVQEKDGFIKPFDRRSVDLGRGIAK